MNNHFMKVENISDSVICWEECLKELKCHMVSYNHNNKDCILFEEVKTESINFIDDTNSTTITYENIDEKKFRYAPNLSDYTLYNKTQISGFYLHLNSESKELCLRECLRRKDVCIAISFGENRCHLVKKGEYQLRLFNNWSTIYLEKRTPISTEMNYTNILEDENRKTAEIDYSDYTTTQISEISRIRFIPRKKTTEQIRNSTRLRIFQHKDAYFSFVPK